MIYVGGSLRSTNPASFAEMLRKDGHEVFDSWRAPGPNADDEWKKYEQSKGLTFLQALSGPAARQVFEFDKRWLDMSDALVAVQPFGKSAIAECGYVQWVLHKPVFILLEETERWDVMLQFFQDREWNPHGGIYDHTSMDKLREYLKEAYLPMKPMAAHEMVEQFPEFFDFA